MIRFNCIHCGVRIEVDDRFAGKTGNCQQCHQPVTVPELEPNIGTGLDSLREAPDITPVSIGAYGKAADAGWVDPAAKAAAEAEAAEAARKKAEAEAVPLPDIPAEILAAAKARKKQNMKYIMGAALLALVVIVLLLPLIVPKKEPKPEPAPIAPAPKFGEEAPAQP